MWRELFLAELIEFRIRGVVLFRLGTLDSFLEVAGEVLLVELGAATAQERRFPSVQTLVIYSTVCFLVSKKSGLERFTWFEKREKKV